MKQIWNELIDIASVESKCFQEAANGFNMRIPAGVRTVTTHYIITADAMWDNRYKVFKLVLTCQQDSCGEFMHYRTDVATETELQTFDSRENAIRWLIERVEKFKAQMLALVPPTDTRSDEDVERAYYAEVERRKQAKAQRSNE